MQPSRRTALTLVLIIGALVLSDLAWAQDAPQRGAVRVQGRELGGPVRQPAAIAPQITLDPQGEMRAFVQSIADYARQKAKGFEVAVMGGRQLLTKTEFGNEDIKLPAMAYLISIDAAIAEGVFFGKDQVGVPPEPEIQQSMIQDLKMAKDNATPVFIIDYVKNQQQASRSLQQADKMGFVSFPAWAAKHQLDKLPPWQDMPMNENAQSVRSLRDVKNFTLITRPDGMGPQDEFALAVHDTNYDLIIVNPFHGREPLTARAVETLKYKKLGARRLVFAHVNIGEAAAYHFYWKPGWREGSPAFIGEPLPGAADRYYARYWDPAWQAIISGNDQSFIAGIIQLGFDGVILDGADSVSFFQGG